MAQAPWMQQLIGISRGGLGVPVLLLVILAMVVLPIPAFLLDVFFTFNIALALVVLSVSVYAMRPLDFAVFPTILLVSTLLRLALNVASTRVVLLYGHAGGDAAGKVIESFGEVVIGGNYVVGMVVFMILVIINFVVVTKGAGRISEVSARFTLDAMPGKQMAIDADLNAGLISQDDARSRRSEVTMEADFYGSMDGASKFVRGDAVAGLLILAINIIGGLLIGTMQHALEFGDALQKYSLLTIGDGLVAQIPGLVLSTAAAIMVTRVSESEDMGSQVGSQMFGNPRSLGVAACILIVMGLVPGMPHTAFLGLGSLAAAGSWLIYKRQQQPAVAGAGAPSGGGPAPAGAGGGAPAGPALSPPPAPEIKELGWDDVQPVDMVGLEVGYRMIPLVDKNQGGQLLSRIKGVRKKLSQELGFLIPTVHIRDNLDLMPNVYRISLMGVPIAEAEVHPDRDLAINPGQVFGQLDGIAGKDPAFGLDAIWIEPSRKEQAQTMGYTVVDASTVVATHLNQLLFGHAHELLGHDEVQQMLKLLARTSPKLAEELPARVATSVLLKVLQNLLLEKVPVRDIRTIAEALAEAGGQSKDPVTLTQSVRVALRRSIIQNLVGSDGEIPVITVAPQLEQVLQQTVHQSMQQGAPADESLILEPTMAEKLQVSLQDAAQRQELAGQPAILLVAALIRPALARFCRMAGVNVHVLSYQEIPDNRQVTITANVGTS